MTLETMEVLSPKERDIDNALLEFKKEEITLQEDVILHSHIFSNKENDTEENKIREVKRLKSDRIRLPYNWKWKQWDFIFERKWNKALVWVKVKWKDWERYTKDNTSLLSNKGKPLIIKFDNLDQFNKDLILMVNKYIPIHEDIIPKKWKQVFELLKEITSLKQKPINLWYEEINEEKKITNIRNLPDRYSSSWRIMRCLRWKSITDTAEERYDIPKGLLMSIMAQEGYWDPTIPNSSGDWWLGLLHIQWKNAANYWLNVLPMYNKGMIDTKHWKEIKKVLKNVGTDTKKLIKYDDRFHPILAVDVAARFLKDNCYRSSDGKDAWIQALKRYSWRKWLNSYAYKVVQYWATINSYTWDPMPNFSEWVKQVINGTSELKVWKRKNSKWEWKDIYRNTKDMIRNLKISVLNVRFDIGDKKDIWYQWYLEYFDGQCENYGLQKYKELGKYEKNKNKK